MLKRALVIILGLLPYSGGQAQALIEKYQAGKNYFLIEPAQETSSGDKIEVLEVFSYSCIHCAEFQPNVNEWKKSMPPQARFALMPAVWNPPWELMGRTYYAAEVLGIVEKTHDAFFKALWTQRLALTSMDDVAGWYVEQGVSPGLTKEKFLAAANSFAVDAKINRSKTVVPRYAVDGTPTMIVAGKYRITGGSAGTYDAVFDVVNFLIAKEVAARPKPAAAPAVPAKPAPATPKPAAAGAKPAALPAKPDQATVTPLKH